MISTHILTAGEWVGIVNRLNQRSVAIYNVASGAFLDSDDCITNPVKNWYVSDPDEIYAMVAEMNDYLANIDEGASADTELFNVICDEIDINYTPPVIYLLNSEDDLAIRISVCFQAESPEHKKIIDSYLPAV